MHWKRIIGRTKGEGAKNGGIKRKRDTLYVQRGWYGSQSEEGIEKKGTHCGEESEWWCREIKRVVVSSFCVSDRVLKRVGLILMLHITHNNSCVGLTLHFSYLYLTVLVKMTLPTSI